MPVSGGDAALEIKGIGAGRQHIAVVVTLQHYGLAAAQSFLYRGGNDAEVGGVADVMLAAIGGIAVGDAITNAFRAVVRGAEGLKGKCPNGMRKQGWMRHERTVDTVSWAGEQTVGRGACHVYGNGAVLQKYLQCGGVVAMLVREKDGRDRLRRKAGTIRLYIAERQKKKAIHIPEVDYR